MSQNGPVRFRCENCGQKIQAIAGHTGKKGRCPKCKNIIVVPKIRDAAPDADQSAADTSEISSKSSVLDPNLFDIPQETTSADSHGTDDEALDNLQKLHAYKIESEPVPERKRPWLIDIFLYPANQAGLIMIGIFVGIPLLMEFFVKMHFLAASRFPPFYVFASFLLVINLVINIVIMFYKYWYISECARNSAAGQIRAPDTTAVTPGPELIWPFLRIFVCIIIFLVPLFHHISKSRGIDRNIFSLFWFILLFIPTVISEVGKGGTTFHLLLAFAVFFFPITVLSVIMFDSLRGLNPILILRSILKTFIPYCGLILLISLLGLPAILMRKFVVTEVLSGQTGIHLNLIGAVNLYLMLVAAHLLGRFYWKYQDELDWEV
ncbi:MAG: hypothetical protein WC476_11670 [Phycisphaerae bacterium]